ncbi:MAG: tRNA (uridine(34)/cytosine(34)/5-carboxymethylaminomethyluridine(34)-2'-O)-methyltransferase TrmL [Burkholderiales bacterium]
MSYDLVLYQPEIPGNTGNIIRLCANTGVGLHLVKPLGFDLEDKQMKRAGLDYREYADLELHEDWPACVAYFSGRRMFAVTTKGATRYSDVQFKIDDVFVLGPETRGLPPEIIQSFPPEQRLRMPMQAQSRSLNLSNTAAVLVYEAWRQIKFSGGV